MDAQGTMRLMFDTMDAYDRGDFDRLAEIYADDAQWINADPKAPHCRNRDDIFTMFGQRRDAGIRIAFDEMRSTPTRVALTARVEALAVGGGEVSVVLPEGQAHGRRKGPQLAGLFGGGDHGRDEVGVELQERADAAGLVLELAEQQGDKVFAHLGVPDETADLELVEPAELLG